MSLKLGKKEFKEDPRDWKWADFRVSLRKAGLLPTAPVSGWGHGNTFKDWKMLANGPDPTAPGAAAEGCGDCVWASADHETMEALTDSGNKPEDVGKLFTGATAVKDYESTGYDPETGSGDNGTEIREALLYRQKTGIVDISGKRHKIGPFVSVDPSNTQHLLEALFFFEGIPIGVELQEAQMNAFNEAEANGSTPIWTYSRSSQSLGGHCVPLVGHPDSEHYAALSWAKRVVCTKPFISHLADEAWAYVTPERISKVTGESYEGASEEQLERYLHELASG